MPCFKPLFAFQPWSRNSNGKRPLVFAKDINMPDVPRALRVLVPCGKCIGCRLERSRQWALRCVHEASLYDDNCFITLTFDDRKSSWSARNLKLEDRPAVLAGSLVKRDFQKFMKRLRKRFPDSRIRYFHCGEYGGANGRPHHHACLFNFRFPDLVRVSVGSGSSLYVSHILEELWPFGFCSVGDVTFESAAYVARYVLKKWSRDNLKGEELYNAMREFDKDDGDKLAEYVTMSRRPGIGAGWLDSFSNDVYPKDFVTVRGKKCKPPKYYDQRFLLQNEKFMLGLKHDRVCRARDNVDNSLQRLSVREKVAESNASRLRREL